MKPSAASQHALGTNSIFSSPFDTRPDPEMSREEFSAEDLKSDERVAAIIQEAMDQRAQAVDQPKSTSRTFHERMLERLSKDSNTKT